jgi:perosamine synthetase
MKKNIGQSVIPLFNVFMSDTVLDFLSPVIHSGYIGEGEKSALFETKFGEYIGSPNVVVVNSGTSALTLALKLAGVGPGHKVISTPMTCLWGRSKVMLPNGKTEYIINLVKNQYSGNVLSVANDGSVVEKKVIGWHRSKLNKRKWKYVSCDDYQKKTGPRTGSNSGVWVTEEHGILTNRGFVEAKNLSGETLITERVGLTTAQEQFFVGSLLGDGSIAYRNKRGTPRFTTCHAKNQEEWFNLKYEFIKEMGGSVREYPARPGHQPYVFHQTGNHPVFIDMVRRFYPQGEKIVPEDLSEKDLSPMALATWYMDDGSKTAKHSGCLCTNGFVKRDVERLVCVLRRMGFNATLQPTKKETEHRILIRAKLIGADGRKPIYQSDMFFSVIAPFVPDSMKYKLPDDVIGIPFNKTLWSPIKFPRYRNYAKITDGEPSHDAKRTVYCLDVEDTHNFIVNGIVVHNCLATNEAILSVGAIPVWADILSDGTIDPEDVRAKMGPGIKAIMCMDWGGLPCQLDELREIGKEFKVPVIEDACQSIGSKYKGRHVGSDVDYVAFSTQAIKALTSVDGGFLAVNSAPYQVDLAKMMRWFGLDRASGADMRCNQDPPLAGYKWQMNDVLATIGLANMEGLEERIDKTLSNAITYDTFLGMKRDHNRQSSFWLYTIYVHDPAEFIQYMKSNGVECSRVHDRNDTKTIFKKSRCVLPGVDWFDNHHVCIPVGWWLIDKDIERILDLLWKCRGDIINEG